MYEYVFPKFTFKDSLFYMVCESGKVEDIWSKDYFSAIFVEINFKFPFSIEKMESNNELV